MTAFRLALLMLVLAPPSGTTFAQQAPSADAIMARVAENQNHSEAERSHYIYVRHAKVTSRKGKTVMCEEITDSRVTPSGSGSHVELLKLDGRVLHERKYDTYTTLAGSPMDSMAQADHDSVSINIGNDDREMVESMRASLINDDSDTSKDGMNARLFPLTSKGQLDYVFHYVGRERLNGRDVFHLDFRPKDKSDFDWKGDAWIDADAYQPVVISTGMSRNVPLAVRMLLGTNVPGLGFTVVYAPQPDGVWFPVSFGTEFKIHVLFFFRREIIIDAHNRDFEKTHVDVKISDGPLLSQ